MEADNFVDEETQSILGLMKESKIYWQVKRDLINLMLKNKSTIQLSPAELHKQLLLSNNSEKLTGLINNCLQKSTRRLPIERDLNPEI